MQLLDRTCAYAGTLGYGISEVDAEEGHDDAGRHRNAQAPGFFPGRRCDPRGDRGIVARPGAASRIDGVVIDTAIVHEPERDHLDYHGDMRAYAEAKASLFTRTSRLAQHRQPGFEIRCRACSTGRLRRGSSYPRIRDWTRANALPHVFVRSVGESDRGRFAYRVVDSSWGEARISLPRCPAASTLSQRAARARVPAERRRGARAAASAALENIGAPPGQAGAASTVRTGLLRFTSTTPTRRTRSTSCCRRCGRTAHGNLWCVFGCGGDRDQGKRPHDGDAWRRQHADRIVVTTDNPRSESPARSSTKSSPGCQRPGGCHRDRGSRNAAIAWAIEQAADGRHDPGRRQRPRELPADRHRAARFLGLCRGSRNLAIRPDTGRAASDGDPRRGSRAI